MRRTIDVLIGVLLVLAILALTITLNVLLVDAGY